MPLAIKTAWLFSAAHLLLGYLATVLTITYFREVNFDAVEDYVRLNKWFAWKGLDRYTVNTAAFYACALSPLSVIAWHFFFVDARPRRPTPKLWHSLFTAAYFLPIAALFYQTKDDRDGKDPFHSPLLQILTSSDIGICALYCSVVWLLSGLAYATILPLVEMHQSKTEK